MTSELKYTCDECGKHISETSNYKIDGKDYCEECSKKIDPDIVSSSKKAIETYHKKKEYVPLIVAFFSMMIIIFTVLVLDDKPRYYFYAYFVVILIISEIFRFTISPSRPKHLSEEEAIKAKQERKEKLDREMYLFEKVGIVGCFIGFILTNSEIFALLGCTAILLIWSYRFYRIKDK